MEVNHSLPYLRLSYAVWLVEELVRRIPASVDMNIMYDISCTLVKHLKANKNGFLLDHVQFSIPSFHAYGHNAACQVTSYLFATALHLYPLSNGLQ